MRSKYPFYNPESRVALLGGTVVLLWGITAWLRGLSAAIPALELTGFALAGAAVASLFLPGALGTGISAVRGHPWYVWPTVIGSWVGSSALFYIALTRAPAAQVVVITYSWPLVFAISSAVYSRRRPAGRTVIALLVALAGVIIMQGTMYMPSMEAWLGYAASLSAGLCWVVYSLFEKNYRRSLAPTYPVFFALSAMVALGLQIVAMGGLVWPHSPVAWTAAVFLGIGPYGLGFIAWGYVVRRGNPNIVPLLPYAVPIVAAATLVLAGRTQPTLSLLGGCMLVIIACVLSSRSARRKLHPRQTTTGNRSARDANQY